MESEITFKKSSQERFPRWISGKNKPNHQQNPLNPFALDSFQWKFTGSHGFYNHICDFPVNCPTIHFCDRLIQPLFPNKFCWTWHEASTTKGEKPSRGVPEPGAGRSARKDHFFKVDRNSDMRTWWGSIQLSSGWMLSEIEWGFSWKVEFSWIFSLRCFWKILKIQPVPGEPKWLKYHWMYATKCFMKVIRQVICVGFTLLPM